MSTPRKDKGKILFPPLDCFLYKRRGVEKGSLNSVERCAVAIVPL